MRKLFIPAMSVVLMMVCAAIAYADEDETIVVTGVVAEVNSNDIILKDGLVINTSPKSYSNDMGWEFVDADENGDNDLLEALIGEEITVEGEPVYEEIAVVDPDTGEPVLDPDTGEPVTELVLVAVDAYKIQSGLGDIFIREPGKAPWAKGPKS